MCCDKFSFLNTGVTSSSVRNGTARVVFFNVLFIYSVWIEPSSRIMLRPVKGKKTS